MAEKIAVDLGGTSIRVALVSGARLKAKIKIATEAMSGQKISFHNLVETIRSLWKPTIKSINMKLKIL